MQWVGHRGDPRHAPENTLASFESAWRHGRRAVECDVRASREGVPIVFHDATLERMGAGQGPVANQPWRTLRTAQIPSVADVLAVCRRRRLTVFFDLKTPRAAGRLPSLLRAAGMTHRTRVASQHPRALAIVQRVAPRLLRYRVTGYRDAVTPRLIRQAQQRQWKGFIAYKRWVTPAVVSRLAREGLELYVWTVRTRDEEERFRRMGVTGVMTERCPRSNS